MINPGEVHNRPTICLRDSLVAKADAQDAFCGTVSPDQIKGDSGLSGYSRTRTDKDLIKSIYLIQRNFIVPADIHRLLNHPLDVLDKVVSERIIIINNQYFHKSTIYHG